MVKKSLLCVVACAVLFSIRADTISNNVDQQTIPTKDQILTTLTSPNLNPRTLQTLATAFYWSYQSKRTCVKAIYAAKRNMLLADNILLKSYNLEYAHDERVLSIFKELHQTWQTAHQMQRALNACVGIVTFKEEINDLANAILTRMCSDAAATLLEKKEAVLERAQQRTATCAKNGDLEAQFVPKIEAFYTALESQNLEMISPSMRTMNNYISNLMHTHFTATHTLHDIRTDIMSLIDDVFAQEFLGWYRAIYATMEERELLDTSFGTIICDHTGLIDEANRTQQLPNPDSLT
jgi:hypothetical protein